MKSSLLLTLCAIFFWGVWGLFTKLASTRISSLQVAAGSFVSSTIILLGYLLITKKLFPIQTDPQGFLFTVLAGFFTALGSLCFYLVLQKNPAGILVAVTSLYPLVTVLLSFVFLGEVLTIRQFAGIALAIGGLVLLSL